MACQETNMLAVEIRNHDEKYADFATISLTTGEVLCNGLTSPPDNDWLCSLEAIADNGMVLSHFADEQNPVRSGITVVNANTGDSLWHLDGYTYGGHLDKKKILLSDVKQRSQLWASATNGTLLEGFSLKAENNEEVSTRLLYPTAYTEEQEHFKTIANWIVDQISRRPVRVVEYIETENYFIVSYHTKHAKGYDLHLVVAHVAGQILLQEQLGTDMKGCASGTFFVLSNSIIFVKDKVTLYAYSLP